MGDYEHSTTVTTDADALFVYLSDVNNLPSYFSSMRSAEPAGGDAVHTVAEVEGQKVEGEAWFTTDAAARSIRWGSEGENNYNGELKVDEAGSSSTVTVTLHTEHADGDRIDAGLKETLEHIKTNVEGGADAAAPTPS